MISVDLIESESFRNLSESVKRDALAEARNAAGEAAATELQDHFAGLNQRPNKRGWPKRGFWADVLKTVNAQALDDEYDIGVASPEFWRRYKGGSAISPKTGPRKLAIPATAAAYAAGRPASGRVPVELMVLVRRKDGKLQGVGLAEFTTRPSKRDPAKTVRVPGTVWYWLVASTNPPADPNAAPSAQRIQDVAQTTAHAYLQAKYREVA